MADFDPPFAYDDDAKRLPTSPERQEGFPCGPADRNLFNGLFHRIESEIGEVIDFAGLTPSDADFTQLRQAIEALILAATGGGDPSLYLLITQARARLPIFPDVFTTDGTFGVVSPGVGQVRVPAGVNFQHRGIYPIISSQVDIATVASKTYHLRWNPTDGFTLKDLSSGVYNPGALVESADAFDSTYDDMLVARVVTNASNILTITNLENRARLAKRSGTEDTTGITTGGAPAWRYSKTFTETHNWARQPTIIVPWGGMASENVLATSVGLQGQANAITITSFNRYQVGLLVASDFDSAQSNPIGYYTMQLAG